MEWHERKLVTIIGEAALEKRLIDEARALGIGGYTVTEVRGGGAHGERGGEWEGERSIEFKVVCDEAGAEHLAQVVMERYSPNYALVLYVSDVGVMRGQKFSPRTPQKR